MVGCTAVGVFCGEKNVTRSRAWLAGLNTSIPPGADRIADWATIHVEIDADDITDADAGDIANDDVDGHAEDDGVDGDAGADMDIIA